MGGGYADSDDIRTDLDYASLMPVEIRETAAAMVFAVITPAISEGDY